MAQRQRLVIAPQQLHGQSIHLTAAQQHYLQRVLRLELGDRFIAMNGQGQSWLAMLVRPEANLEAAILEPVTIDNELPVTVTLVLALPKTGFDDVVRQATELGVTEIVPVVSDRTLLQPSAAKLERWRRIAQEAAEQSERQTVPPIASPVPFASYLQQSVDPVTAIDRYICVTRQSAPHLLHYLSDARSLMGKTGQNGTSPAIVVAIGPEGGWTDAEVDQAIVVGYQPTSLGSRILRAVTAPLAALALVAAACESGQ